MSHTFSGDVSVLQGSLSGKLSPADTDVKVYEGSYEITPDALVAQTLATKNRLLKKDITVESVPHSETSNAAGGTTFYIG